MTFHEILIGSGSGILQLAYYTIPHMSGDCVILDIKQPTRVLNTAQVGILKLQGPKFNHLGVTKKSSTQCHTKCGKISNNTKNKNGVSKMYFETGG